MRVSSRTRSILQNRAKSKDEQDEFQKGTDWVVLIATGNVPHNNVSTRNGVH